MIHSIERHWSVSLRSSSFAVGSPMEATPFRSRSFRRLILLIGLCVSIYITATTSKLQGGIVPGLAGLSSQEHRMPPIKHSPAVNEQVVTQDNTNFEPELAPKLPVIVRIPFEEAVKDIQLGGWEDQWFSEAKYNVDKFGHIHTPKIDFAYNWVNGSDDAFKDVKHYYEVRSPLNDKAGKWLSAHSVNRYRDWDELRYSFRSLDKYASSFINKIQLLVNSVPRGNGMGGHVWTPQRPGWLRDDMNAGKEVQTLAQEDFFAEDEKKCIPSFDSVSIESQIHNTPSEVDQLVALSDDMFLGAPHTAADFFSPLFGPMMGFKPETYNVKDIRAGEIPHFGEKPYLYYTSWLLNHRFGERDRKVQAHFTHSVSRRVLKEAMESFPLPAKRGTCERFRGESQYQIYPWYAAFHYSIERFREVLLWSYIIARADANGDGYLDWGERQNVLSSLRAGIDSTHSTDTTNHERTGVGRGRMYYELPDLLQEAGLEAPVSNVNILWTSLDGPYTIHKVKCQKFNIDMCFAESFGSPMSDTVYRNPDFTAAGIFTRLAKDKPKCGDCLIKYLLATSPRGLSPMLPLQTDRRMREMVIKALVKYQHTVFEPEGHFVMVKDADQARHELLHRAIVHKEHVAQWCLNDDVMTEDQAEVQKVNDVIQAVFKRLFPTKSPWEK